jgi:hypothetical protein
MSEIRYTYIITKNNKILSEGYVDSGYSSEDRLAVEPVLFSTRERARHYGRQILEQYPAHSRDAEVHANACWFSENTRKDHVWRDERNYWRRAEERYAGEDEEVANEED